MATPPNPDNISNTTEEVKQKARELLPQLRERLGPKAKGVSDANLLKFLHWKPCIERATERFHAHIQWRTNNSFVFDSDPPLEVTKDDQLKRVLESEFLVAPDGLVDETGNTVIIGRFRNNDMSDGRTPQDVVRTTIFTIDRVLEEERTQMNGITIVHDLEGLGRNNLHPAIPQLLFGDIFGKFPLRVQAMYLCKAPFIFYAIWNVISLLMSSKIRERVHFVDDISEVPIKQEDLLVEYGGNREYDAKEWVQAQMRREQDGSTSSLAGCFCAAETSDQVEQVLSN